MILSLSHHICSHIAAKYPTVFAVITTFVKYVRTVLHQTGHFARYNSTKLRCQYVRYRSKCTIQNDKFVWSRYSQELLSRKGPISWHTPSNLFALYFFVNIYYGTYERYATVPLLPRYQHYRRPYRLCTNGTGPRVPLCWSVCEHWYPKTLLDSAFMLALSGRPYRI
jgi:hypothetical protein